MATLAQDNFTAADTTVINGRTMSDGSSTWESGTDGALEIISNAAEKLSGVGFACAQCDSMADTADQQVSAKCQYRYSSPIARMTYDGSDMEGYLRYTTSNPAKLGKSVSGTFTQIGSDGSDHVSDKVIMIKCVGTTIEMYYDGGGTPDASGTDSTYSTGKAGICTNFTHPVDDFLAESVGAPPASVVIFRRRIEGY